MRDQRRPAARTRPGRRFWPAPPPWRPGPRDRHRARATSAGVARRSPTRPSAAIAASARRTILGVETARAAVARRGARVARALPSPAPGRRGPPAAGQRAIDLGRSQPAQHADDRRQLSPATRGRAPRASAACRWPRWSPHDILDLRAGAVLAVERADGSTPARTATAAASVGPSLSVSTQRRAPRPRRRGCRAHRRSAPAASDRRSSGTRRTATAAVADQRPARRSPRTRGRSPSTRRSSTSGSTAAAARRRPSDSMA